MWHEGDIHRAVPAQLAKLLSQLRKVAVAADGVGTHRLVDLAEVDAQPGRAARPAHARLGVNHEIGRGQAGGDSRRQGEDGCRRVAAGNSDQLRFLEIGRMQLGKSEHSLGQQSGLGMLLFVVHGVLLRILKAEVGAHVDHPRAGCQPRAGPAGADVVGQAAEHDVEASGIRLRLELAFEVEQRKDFGIGLTRERPRGELGQLHAGVAGQQADKRHPGIAVGAGHCNLHHPAHKRMSIQITA
ncbi:MAG: hypothetical protein NVS9B11_16800 [Candidatus Dormibacteraceae bacterium]